MDTINKNELNDMTGRLMGFCYLRHPDPSKGRRNKIQMCVYHVLGTNRYPLAFSDVKVPKGKKVKDFAAQMKLGVEVPMKYVVPYLQREISGGDWKVVRETLQEATNASWHFFESHGK